MPLYEYRCDQCDKSFEILQRMGAGADGLSCPGCGGFELRKQFSTFSASSPASSSAGATAGGRAAPACGTGFT